jgi:hypothetical protein
MEGGKKKDKDEERRMGGCGIKWIIQIDNWLRESCWRLEG